MRRILLALPILLAALAPALADNYTATQGTGTTFAAKNIGGVLYPWWIPANSSGTELFTSGNAAYVQFPSAQAVTAAQATAANLNMTEANSAAILSAIQGAIPAGTNTIGTLNPTTPIACTSLCANLVVKNSAGNLYSFEVAADSTLSGAAWWIMVYNATSAPGDGSVTPIKCYAAPSGATNFNAAFTSGGIALSTGITIGVSTNGCYTKAASIHAFISADYQ